MPTTKIQTLEYIKYIYYMSMDVYLRVVFG